MFRCFSLRHAPWPSPTLTFADGAVPVAVTSAPSDLRVGIDQAVGVIVGSSAKVSVLRKPSKAQDVIEMTLSSPAPTKFERFFPSIVETPSPHQTFVGTVEVLGAVASVDGPCVTLARGDLAVHDGDGQTTNVAVLGEAPKSSVTGCSRKPFWSKLSMAYFQGAASSWSLSKKARWYQDAMMARQSFRARFRAAFCARLDMIWQVLRPNSSWSQPATALSGLAVQQWRAIQGV